LFLGSGDRPLREALGLRRSRGKKDETKNEAPSIHDTPRLWCGRTIKLSSRAAWLDKTPRKGVMAARSAAAVCSAKSPEQAPFRTPINAISKLRRQLKTT